MTRIRHHPRLSKRSPRRPECARHDSKRSGLKNVSWRAAPSLWRRSAPPGFIRPCEPTLVNRPPAGPGWLHEIKHDGFRVLAWKQGERVTVWSRRGTDFTGRFSRIADAVRGVSADEATIDGEAVVFLNDGRSDFHALFTKQGWEQAAFVAFDLLRLGGDDLRQRPLEKRREALMRLIAKRRGDGILFSEPLDDEGVVVFMTACEMGLEGIVSKRQGSSYKSGPTRNWLKTKNPDFVRT